MEKKTIRLIVPDWQAGDNPVYYFGAKILQVIAPKKEGQKEITIPVPDDFKPLERENGVTAQSAVYQQVKDTVSAIDKEAPDKIITFGGNCLVSQAPFAYLNEKYDDLGVLWVDAHPDISNPEIYENEHAMVLANLLGAGDPKLSGLVRKTLKLSQVRYEGMQGGVDVEQAELDRLGVSYAAAKGNELDAEGAISWIRENGIKHIALHLDCDVMDPHDFYATYFNNPALGPIPYNAATGHMKRASVWDFIEKISKETDLVGFTIAEYMPWSAMQMRELMKRTKIFG